MQLQPLIDKIEGRLAGYKGCMLSRAGRSTILKAVLTAMPIYQLTVLDLPVWVRKWIDKRRRAWFWSGKDSYIGEKCWVNLNVLCRPKKYGGLGVLELKRFSRALRPRWLWYQWKTPEKLWCGVQLPVDEEDECCSGHPRQSF